MTAIKPLSSLAYDFDFLRLPFHGQVDRPMVLPKAAGAGTGWAAGDTVYAATSTGVVTVTGSDTGSPLGVGVSMVLDDAVEAVVHVQGVSSVTPYELQRAGVLEQGLMHIAGTTSAIWSTRPGFITPAGDNAIVLNDAKFSGLFDMGASLESLVVMYCAERSALQAADNFLLQCGSRSKIAPGGVTVQARTNGIHEFEVWPNEVAGVGNTTTKAWPSNERNWLCHMADATRDVIETSRDGDATNAGSGVNDPGTIAANLGAGRNFAGDVSAAHAFTVLSGNNGVGAAERFLNEGDPGGDLSVSDLLIARNAFTLSSLIPAFADYRDGQWYERRLRRVAG